MEMRKFIIELHPDGSMSWAEYAEPINKEERDRLFSEAFRSVSEEVDTYPVCSYTPAAKAAYLAGAARMASILRRALML